jgi:uncharacterized protein (TIGR02246 family)
MRRLALMTTILVPLISPAVAQDSATVQRLADQFADAFNKNAASGIGDFYTDDAVLIPPGTDMRTGRRDIQAYWAQQAKQAEGLTVTVLDVKPLGPDAARAVVRAEMTPKGDKPGYVSGRNVAVLQKVGADWKLATHIWNFSADSLPAALSARQHSGVESRGTVERDSSRERDDDVSRRSQRRDRDDEDGYSSRRFSDRERGFRERGYWGDDFEPRDRRYDRRRFGGYD